MDMDVKWFGNRGHMMCLHAVVPGVRLLCKQRVTSCLRWRTNRTNDFYLFTIYKLKLNSVWWFVTCKFIFYRFFAVCRQHLFSVAKLVALMCILSRYIFAHFFFTLSFSWFIFIFFSHIALWKWFAKLHLASRAANECLHVRARCEQGAAKGVWEKQSHIYLNSALVFIFRKQATKYHRQRQRARYM